jgi:exodeoxyribonuclease VII large subunit
MNEALLRRLKKWRDDTALKERVESFRVLPNATLVAIAEAVPKTKNELVAIRGIKDRKFAKYGEEILRLVSDGEDSVANVNAEKESSENASVRVGEFLDRVNIALGSLFARVRGEVSSVQYRGNAVYFTIRDDSEQASMACFAWAQNIAVFGVELVEGMEVIVSGSPSVYKPSGRLSFHVDAIEPVGEGALKAAYDRLIATFESEGLLDPLRKRSLPAFPKTVGIITSRDGAVIHDFLNNSGKNGFRFLFRDSRVEGQMAVSDLLSAIEMFSTQPLDVLVIMRGGGSLESLQAFNNEAVVRAIANAPFPVIAAIGHHRDMPIVSLVADLAVSTPTAAAQALNTQWDALRQRTTEVRHQLLVAMQTLVDSRYRKMERFRSIIESGVSAAVRVVSRTERRFFSGFSKYESRLRSVEGFLYETPKELDWALRRMARNTNETLLALERALRSYDPERRLRSGYAIVRDESGNIVSTVARAQKSAILTVSVADGTFAAKPVLENKTLYGETTQR